MISRRALLAGGAAFAVAPRLSAEPRRAPVVFVSHGAPLFLPGQAARRATLANWGKSLAKPRAIVVMTPHFAARKLALGATGPGFAWYDLPNGIKRLLPQDLEYSTPPSVELASELEGILGERVERASTRRGFDHTTWMPLKCLFPAADVPVLEVTYPYVPESRAFAFGERLSALRDDGVLFLASGGLTHNLSLDLEAPVASATREFDAWAAHCLETADTDALIDFRKRAPAPDFAHPDDGAHFRVLLVALGLAHGKGGAVNTTFPVTGFEGPLSTRCVQFE